MSDVNTGWLEGGFWLESMKRGLLRNGVVVFAGVDIPGGIGRGGILGVACALDSGANALGAGGAGDAGGSALDCFGAGVANST